MRIPDGPPRREDLCEFLRQGPSLLVATRDERMVVELTRCAAAEVGADGRVHVAIPLPEGRRTLANIALTSTIALSAAQPTDYVTVQLKGTDARRVEWPEQERVVQAHRARFAAVLSSIGMKQGVALLSWSECVAVVFTPLQIFNQTPGPDAGLELMP